MEYYLRLLDYGERLEGFRAGIEGAVEPGDRVLDVGTGLGTFALFAAGAGAERVWAVDRDPVVHVARELAEANGLQDRVELVRGEVPGVDLPEEIDVLIFEDFPDRFLDARTFRLLKHLEEKGVPVEGGRTIPRRARLALAPAHALSGVPRVWPGGGGSWRERERRYGIDWTPVRPYLANLPRTSFLAGDRLRGDAALGPPFPLIPAPTAGDLVVEGRWEMVGTGPIDALVLWFDLEVAPGRWVTNRPGFPTGPWGQVLLPLDPPFGLPSHPSSHARGGAAVRAEAEEVELEARVFRDALEDGAPGWLRWEAAVAGERRTGHEFAGHPAGLEDL